MQKSYECEVATHIGPESCGAASKGGVEALTGERAGRVFSRVRNSLRDPDAPTPTFICFKFESFSEFGYVLLTRARNPPQQARAALGRNSHP